MGVRVTSSERVVALFDSTSGTAFGPVFDDEADAHDFLEHLRDIGERDPRVIPALELAELAREFMEDR